ncbi:MAG: efflux RND transporter periplasmic adaptor subunit [Balneolaceae bacterium]
MNPRLAFTPVKSPLFVLALFLIVTGCGNGGTEENGENERSTTPVHVEEIEPTDFRHFVNVQGDVESEKTIMISPKASATVEEILVRTGEDVEKDDVLARLDGDITRSQLREVETQLELAETLFERQRNLRDQDIGSEVEFLQAQNQVESFRRQLATLNEQYENYTIRATISGTVDLVDLKVGETADPATPVFQIANSEALKVTARVSEAYITRISQTDSVEIRFTSLDETIRKQLDVVSKAINASNRTFGVEIFIPNENGNIRPNMMARVKINDVTESGQIVVPANTVQSANQTDFVFVAEETDAGWIASNREVVTGMNYENDLVITEGLEAGDLLITAGYANLSNGAAISIQENN